MTVSFDHSLHACACVCLPNEDFCIIIPPKQRYNNHESPSVDRIILLGKAITYRRKKNNYMQKLQKVVGTAMPKSRVIGRITNTTGITHIPQLHEDMVMPGVKCACV